MKRGIFVTGTDTGVGKTLVASFLISALKQHHAHPHYFKPVQTGGESDTEILTQRTQLSFTKPSYSLAMPASPDRAAQNENTVITLDKILQAWSELSGPCVVEGAGGLLVPLNDKDNMCTLALALETPLLIVARTQLGTINHTLMTIACAKSAGLKILGVVLNGPADPGLAEVIERHGGVSVVAHIPPLENIDSEDVSRFGGEFFPPPLLKEFFGDFF